MQVQRYEPGLNEWLDVLLEEGEIVWRINGDRGIRPIAAETSEEAKEKYLAIPKK